MALLIIKTATFGIGSERIANGLKIYNLPSYSPEFNAVETLWKFTRKEGTHNASFESKSEVIDCVTEVFDKIQKYPQAITGYLKPFH